MPWYYQNMLCSSQTNLFSLSQTTPAIRHLVPMIVHYACAIN